MKARRLLDSLGKEKPRRPCEPARVWTVDYDLGCRSLKGCSSVAGRPEPAERDRRPRFCGWRCQPIWQPESRLPPSGPKRRLQTNFGSPPTMPSLAPDLQDQRELGARQREPAGHLSLLLHAETDCRRGPTFRAVCGSSTRTKYGYQCFAIIAIDCAIRLHGADVDERRITLVPLIAFWSLRSLRPLRAGRSLWTGYALNSLSALRARRALRSRIALWSRLSSATN